MLSDQDPLLPSASNLFYLDLHEKSTLNTFTEADLQLKNDVVHSLEEVASSQSSVIFETEPNLENMESGSSALISKDEQSNEDALKAIRPTSKEFKKTWGFRSSTIAKREGAGDTEMEANPQTPPQITRQQQIQQIQQVRQQLQLHLQQFKERHSTPSQSSLRRSGRQPKRTERVEEFMTAVRRNRIRRSAPTPLEDTSETSCPVTDIETASEGSVESMAEIKSESLRNDTGDTEDPLMTSVAELKDDDDDDSSSDSDALTLKEIQDRLRKRQSGRITAETFAEHVERQTQVELPSTSVDEVAQQSVNVSAVEQQSVNVNEMELPSVRVDLSAVKLEPQIVKVEPPDFEVEMCMKSMPPPKVNLLNVKVELASMKVEPPTTPERKPKWQSLVVEECVTAVEIKKEITDCSGLPDFAPEDAPKPRPGSNSSEFLYCICRQPPNRFMICCDRCEKWFHGDCVGISEARGHLMELNEEDYICPNCILLPVKEEFVSDSDQVVSKPQQGYTDNAVFNSMVSEKSDPGIKGRIEKAANPSKKKKLKLFKPVVDAPVAPKCIGPGCSILALPDSVYCSPDCILKHAAATMKFLNTGKDSKLKEKVKSKPVKIIPLKTPTMETGKNRPTRTADKRAVKTKKIIIVSKVEEIASSVPSEPLGDDSPPSWESDHNYNAVKLEKSAVLVEDAAASPSIPSAAPPPPLPPPAPITPGGFYKSGKEDDTNQVEQTSLVPNPPALPSMKKRIAALPRIPMLKRPQSSDTAQSQAPRPSPLSSVNLPLNPPISVASHTHSKCAPSTRQIVQSAVGAAPAMKKSKLSPGTDESGKKTDAPSSSSSSVAGIVKLEGSATSLSSISVVVKAESPSTSLSSAAEAIKKIDTALATIGAVGAAKRIEATSTSNTPAKPATNPSQPQPNLQMRLNIRRSLKEILWKRVGDSDDLVMPEGEVAKVAVNIEKEMFGLFKETDSRYKSKYRNIMLNLKDPKNQGLYHRVLREEISLSKLVRLKPEELISKRLSSWKARPPKSNIDSKNKSHLETRGSDTRLTFADMEDSPPVSSSDELEPPPPESAKPVAPEKSHATLPDIFSSMLNDTTNQHRAHLFDLNCRICTGQMVVSDDDTPRRAKTQLVVPKKTEMKPKSDFSIKAESVKSTAVSPPAGEVAETKESASSASETGSKTVLEKAATPQGSESGELTLPKQGPLYHDTSAAAVVTTTVTVSGRDPRTALNRPAVKVAPASDLFANLAREKNTVGENKSEMPKPIITTFAAPKSILMKPSSSLDPRYLPSSSMNHNITACPSPQDGDTSLFLSRLGTIWKGFINMQSVAKFVTKAYPVSGSIDYLDEDLPDTIHIGGRISPKTVWEYVSKLKSSVSKELCLIRFHPATEEEEVAYISLYSYFNSRGRFGVVANNHRHIKDLYLIPLSAKDPIPSKLLPFDGPGLESTRPNLLLGLVICQKGKRPMSILESEKMEEKKSKVQIQEETDIIYSKAPTLFQQEKKILKYQPFSKETTIIPSPPRSPKSPPPAEPPTVAAPTLFSSLPSFKTETIATAATAIATTTTAPSIPILILPETSAPKSATSTAAKSATPLEHILKTLFGKKKPFDSEAECSNLVNDEATSDKKKGAYPIVDPVIQKFGQISKEKILEGVGDDRPYDPEEEYNPEKAFAVGTIAETKKLQKPEQSSETVPKEDEAYDPEDETIFEEAKVVIDFPNKVSSSVKPINPELPGGYVSAITAASSLVEQQKMLEELNKQIEEQKRQLEAQEEALRQQRAAVGVSMAHFSVSDALMSPPPKTSLTKSELFQQEEQSNIKPEVDLSSENLPHVTNTSTNSKHTLDFWQAASRLIKEANQNSNYKVPQERKSESPAKEKPFVSNESKPKTFSLTEQTKNTAVANESMPSTESKPDTDVKASSSEDSPEKDSENLELTDSKSTDSLNPTLSKTSVSKPAFVLGLPVPAETTLQCTFTAPSSKDQFSSEPHEQKCQNDLQSITVLEASRVQKAKLFSQLKKNSDKIDSKQEMASVHQEDKANTAVSQIIETISQSDKEDRKADFPTGNFEENKQTGQYPSLMQNTGPPPPQFTAPHNLQIPPFRAPLLNFPEYRGQAPQPFLGRSPSNNELERGPSADRFNNQNNSVPSFSSAQFAQSSHFEHNRSPSISHSPDEKGASTSQVEDYSVSQNEYQDSWFEGKNAGSSQFEGQRGAGGSQFTGNRGKQTFPFGDQRRPPPPPRFTANRGCVVQHQVGGMRGPTPSTFIGARSPHPNEFAEQMSLGTNYTQERRGPPPNQFEDVRNQQPAFKNQSGGSPRLYLGPKGSRVSRFSDPNEPPQSRFHYHEPSPQNTQSRFNYQEQFPHKAKSSPRSLPEFPNYSPQHRKGWEKDSSAESEEMLDLGQRSPNEFREGQEYDQRTQTFDPRPREREDFNSKDKIIDEEQTHPADNRQSRGFNERRGGRGRGSWIRGRGRNWNRERDGERYREGERYRDGERNRDWDRHRDRETNREWDKSRERDRDQEKSREFERSRDRTRHRERDANKRRERERSRSKDRERNRDIEREERERFRDHDRDRTRDRERERARDRARERDRERDGDRDRCREWDKERGSDRDRGDRDRGKDYKERSTSKENNRDFKADGPKEAHKTEMQASPSIQQT